MTRLTWPALLVAGLLAGCASSGMDSASPETASAQEPKVRRPAVSAASRVTVGELLAKGGKQLTAQDVKTLLSGATVEGALSTSTWRASYAPDGELRGQTFMNYGGKPLNYQGSWWVDDKGRSCWINKRRSGPPPVCVYLYMLGGRYFASDSSETEAPLAVRNVER